MQPLPSGNGRSARVAGAVAALLVLLAVVAFASRGGFGRTSPTTATPGYVNWAMSVFLVVFVLMIPVAIYAYSLQMREYRDRNKSLRARAVRSLVVMFVVFGFVGLVTYLRRHSLFLRLHPLFGNHGSGTGKRSHVLHAKPFDPTFQWPVLWITVALFAAAVAWYLWARAHRPAAAVTEPHPTVAEDLALSLDDAIDDLIAEPDARRAVIAAYARMERTFARHGLRRRPSETATEYLRRLLLELTTRVEAVRRLTGLFEQARFSDHPIDDAMKEDAIASLREIRDELQAAPT